MINLKNFLNYDLEACHVRPKIIWLWSISCNTKYFVKTKIFWSLNEEISLGWRCSRGKGFSPN